MSSICELFYVLHQWAEAYFILLHEGLDFKCDFVQFKSQRKNSTENVTAVSGFFVVLVDL